MAEYRLYKITGDGRIRAPADIQSAITDADAIRAAQDLEHPHNVEVWEGSRCVRIVEPKG